MRVVGCVWIGEGYLQSQVAQNHGLLYPKIYNSLKVAYIYEPPVCQVGLRTSAEGLQWQEGSTRAGGSLKPEARSEN